MKSKRNDTEGLAWLFFKINLLLAVLVVVIYASHVLSTRGLPAPLAGALGVKGNDRFELSWCETRVKAIQVGQGPRVFQDGYKWYRATASSAPVELNFLNVEKWFAEYCKVHARTIENAQTDRVAAVIEFIDGRQVQVLAGPDDTFGWQGTTFESHDLTQALKDAENLK
jgi:hypothetical protein